MLVFIVISLILVLGLAIGIGWLLTLILPFTLFEGTLLGMIASIIIGAIWYNFFRSVPDFIPGSYGFDYDEDEDEEDDFDFDEIPVSRFYKTDADKTWETWFRYEIANGIYVEFQDSPKQIAPLGDKQMQELAVRLADIGVSILKTKSARAKQFKISKAMLKRQMTKMGQQPYDDDILSLAATAINENLDYYYEDLINVIRNKSWHERMDIFGVR
jgi:hypothetical protein